MILPPINLKLKTVKVSLKHNKDDLNDAKQNQNLEYYPVSPWRKEVLDFGAHDSVELTAQIEHA